jgi:hypothetical protein
MTAKNGTHWGVLAAVAVGGFGLGRLPDPVVQLTASLILAVAALGALVWWSRAQATRRWRAALDAYADRAVARQRRSLPRNPRVA